MAGYKISKWGNSNAVRIPNDILKQVNWSTDTEIEFKVVDKTIVIEERNPYDLDFLFKDYKEEYRGEEIDWGAPVGEEVW